MLRATIAKLRRVRTITRMRNDFLSPTCNIEKLYTILMTKFKSTTSGFRDDEDEKCKKCKQLIEKAFGSEKIDKGGDNDKTVLNITELQAEHLTQMVTTTPGSEKPVGASNNAGKELSTEKVHNVLSRREEEDEEAKKLELYRDDKPVTSPLDRSSEPNCDTPTSYWFAQKPVGAEKELNSTGKVKNVLIRRKEEDEEAKKLELYRDDEPVTSPLDRSSEPNFDTPTSYWFSKKPVGACNTAEKELNSTGKVKNVLIRRKEDEEAKKLELYRDDEPVTSPLDRRSEPNFDTPTSYWFSKKPVGACNNAEKELNSTGKVKNVLIRTKEEDEEAKKLELYRDDEPVTSPLDRSSEPNFDTPTSYWFSKKPVGACNNAEKELNSTEKVHNVLSRRKEEDEEARKLELYRDDEPVTSPLDRRSEPNCDTPTSYWFSKKKNKKNQRPGDINLETFGKPLNLRNERSGEKVYIKLDSPISNSPVTMDSSKDSQKPDRKSEIELETRVEKDNIKMRRRNHIGRRALKDQAALNTGADDISKMTTTTIINSNNNVQNFSKSSDILFNRLSQEEDKEKQLSPLLSRETVTPPKLIETDKAESINTIASEKFGMDQIKLMGDNTKNPGESVTIPGEKPQKELKAEGKVGETCDNLDRPAIAPGVQTVITGQETAPSFKFAKVKEEAKTEEKAETKVKAKAEARAEIRAEAKAEAKAEGKAEEQSKLKKQMFNLFTDEQMPNHVLTNLTLVSKGFPKGKESKRKEDTKKDNKKNEDEKKEEAQPSLDRGVQRMFIDEKVPRHMFSDLIVTKELPDDAEIRKVVKEFFEQDYEQTLVKPDRSLYNSPNDDIVKDKDYSLELNPRVVVREYVDPQPTYTDTTPTQFPSNPYQNQYHQNQYHQSNFQYHGNVFHPHRMPHYPHHHHHGGHNQHMSYSQTEARTLWPEQTTDNNNVSNDILPNSLSTTISEETPEIPDPNNTESAPYTSNELRRTTNDSSEGAKQNLHPLLPGMPPETASFMVDGPFKPVNPKEVNKKAEGNQRHQTWKPCGFQSEATNTFLNKAAPSPLSRNDYVAKTVSSPCLQSKAYISKTKPSNSSHCNVYLQRPASKPKDHEISLSEMLKRVRLRARLEDFQQFMVPSSGTKCQPAQGACKQPKSPCPPPQKTCPPEPKICPPSNCPKPKPPCPKPCKPACPDPCATPKCPAPPKKDPCAKYQKHEHTFDILGLVVTLGPVYMPKASAKDKGSDKNELPKEDKAKSLIVEDIFMKFNAFTDSIIMPEVKKGVIMNAILKANINVSKLLDKVWYYAKDYEPWTPIPSWPIPPKVGKKKLVCPQEGCKVRGPPPPGAFCDNIHHPCRGFPNDKKRTFRYSLDIMKKSEKSTVGSLCSDLVPRFKSTSTGFNDEEAKCKKRKRIIKNAFGSNTSGTPEGQVLGKLEVPELPNSTITNEINVLSSTTPERGEEKLAQKVEKIEESPLVDAEQKQPDEINTTRRIEWISDGDACKVDKLNGEMNIHDELAKRCINSPAKEVDKILLEQMELIGLLQPSSKEFNTPVVEDKTIYMAPRRTRRRRRMDVESGTRDLEKDVIRMPLRNYVNKRPGRNANLRLSMFNVASKGALVTQAAKSTPITDERKEDSSPREAGSYNLSGITPNSVLQESVTKLDEQVKEIHEKPIVKSTEYFVDGDETCDQLEPLLMATDYFEEEYDPDAPETTEEGLHNMPALNALIHECADIDQFRLLEGIKTAVRDSSDASDSIHRTHIMQSELDIGLEELKMMFNEEKIPIYPFLGLTSSEAQKNKNVENIVDQRNVPDKPDQSEETVKIGACHLMANNCTLDHNLSATIARAAEATEQSNVKEEAANTSTTEQSCVQNSNTIGQDPIKEDMIPPTLDPNEANISLSEMLRRARLRARLETYEQIMLTSNVPDLNVSASQAMPPLDKRPPPKTLAPRPCPRPKPTPKSSGSPKKCCNKFRKKTIDYLGLIVTRPTEIPKNYTHPDKDIDVEASTVFVMPEEENESVINKIKKASGSRSRSLTERVFYLIQE